MFLCKKGPIIIKDLFLTTDLVPLPMLTLVAKWPSRDDEATVAMANSNILTGPLGRQNGGQGNGCQSQSSCRVLDRI
ncbi:hypothetical protein ACLKA7_010984 [Drosophila subpalustris]